jgi:hypothetical protein
MKLSRNRFPHLAAGAAALPFASRVAGKLYAEVMETQLWRSNVGIAEFGQHNLHHLGSVCANNSDSDVSAKKSADQRMRHKCVRSAVMETQLWRSNVGIAELGQHNLHHLGSVCVPITQTRTYWRRSPPTSACDTNVSDPLNWARDRRIVVP